MKPVDRLTLSNAIHSKTFWVAVVGAILSVAVAAGVPLTSSQTQVIQAALGLLISLVLGGSAIAYAHAKASAQTPPTPKG